MHLSNVRRTALACACIGVLCAGTPLHADSSDWLTFVKENDRLVADDNLGVGDTQQKKYAWGDVNNNGWLDLVVARKQPFTTPGKRVNVLFMNEGGVLVDRTAEYASAVDHDQIDTPPGWPSHELHPTDAGFLTPTNDRYVILFDLVNNGWLDLITAAAINDGDPKHLGHPRVYVNVGSDGDGAWQGFRFENARIPAMLTWKGNAGHNPRFSAVAAGDVTGNGYADLYFADHDSAGVAGGSPQPAGADLNDRFLVNQGASNPGFFSDETSAAFSGTITVFGNEWPFPVSFAGWSARIADVNGSGHADILKQSALAPPVYVGVAYNNAGGSGPGAFDSGDYQVIVGAEAAAYYFSLGDLNSNGLLDIVITSAGVDRYVLNHGTDSDGHVEWSPPFLLPEMSNGVSPSAGFGSNSVIIDLDNTGWSAIIIADVDFDVPGCNRFTNIYRNNRDVPDVTFANASQVIPNADRNGVFDVAAFDLTGNGWIDLVLGRCVGTDVWINIPKQPCPADLTGNGSVGVPDLLQLLSCWGPVTPGCEAADLTDNETVGVADLIELLAQWGECPR